MPQKRSRSSLAPQQLFDLFGGGNRLKQRFSDRPPRVCEWSKCLFQRPSHPSKKIKYFLGGNTGLKCLWTCRSLYRKTMRWWSIRTEITQIPCHRVFFPHLLFSEIVSICVVASSRVPRLTALPEDKNPLLVALTSTCYCQCWLLF